MLVVLYFSRLHIIVFSLERAELLPGPSNHRNHRNRRQSVADLNELLREVQEELDEMGRNPNVR